MTFALMAVVFLVALGGVVGLSVLALGLAASGANPARQNRAVLIGLAALAGLGVIAVGALGFFGIAAVAVLMPGAP